MFSTDNPLNGPNPRNERSRFDTRPIFRLPGKSLKQTQIRVAQPINLCMRGECLLSVCNQKVTPDSHLTILYPPLSIIYVSTSKINKLSGAMLAWPQSRQLSGLSGVTDGRLPRYEG